MKEVLKSMGFREMMEPPLAKKLENGQSGKSALEAKQSKNGAGFVINITVVSFA